MLRQFAVALTPSPLASVGEPDDRHGPGLGLASKLDVIRLKELNHGKQITNGVCRRGVFATVTRGGQSIPKKHVE